MLLEAVGGEELTEKIESSSFDYNESPGEQRLCNFL